VLAACDGQDGVVDGVIEAPQRCRFDPGVLACAPDESGACLSPAQIESARAIYASPQNPATGRAITGLYPGSEAGWATWAGAAPFGTALDHFRFIVKAQPDWMLSEFQFERDVALAEDRDGNTINALNPDLRRYFKKGGKLLHYHGWSDPQISPGVSAQILSAVHGAGHGALFGRKWRKQFRYAQRTRAMGRAGPSTRADSGAAPAWRCCGSHAVAVRLSTRSKV
jgi:feruloyl esterase